MTVIDGEQFTQLNNLNVLDFLYVGGTPVSSTVVAPLLLDSSNQPAVAPLELRGGGTTDDYTHINSGLEFLDGNGDEIWHLWGGDPDEGAAGFHNLFIGLDSGHNVQTSGNIAGQNTAVGSHSYEEGTTGENNSAFGSHALQVVTTGSNNCAFGTSALDSLTFGDNNCAFGERALAAATDVSDNTAFGANALRTLTGGGNENVAVGCQAGDAAKGSNNVLIGHQAGFTLDTGSNNILIGHEVAAGDDDGDLQINIGDVITGSIDTNAPAIIIAMQTTEPALTGALWNDNGIVKVVEP